MKRKISLFFEKSISAILSAILLFQTLPTNVFAQKNKVKEFWEKFDRAYIEDTHDYDKILVFDYEQFNNPDYENNEYLPSEVYNPNDIVEYLDNRNQAILDEQYNKKVDEYNDQINKKDIEEDFNSNSLSEENQEDTKEQENSGTKDSNDEDLESLEKPKVEYAEKLLNQKIYYLKTTEKEFEIAIQKNLPLNEDYISAINEEFYQNEVTLTKTKETNLYDYYKVNSEKENATIILITENLEVSEGDVLVAKLTSKNNNKDYISRIEYLSDFSKSQLEKLKSTQKEDLNKDDKKTKDLDSLEFRENNSLGDIEIKSQILEDDSQKKGNFDVIFTKNDSNKSLENSQINYIYFTEEMMNNISDLILKDQDGNKLPINGNFKLTNLVDENENPLKKVITDENGLEKETYLTVDGLSNSEKLKGYILKDKRPENEDNIKKYVYTFSTILNPEVKEHEIHAKLEMLKSVSKQKIYDKTKSHVLEGPENQNIEITLKGQGILKDQTNTTDWKVQTFQKTNIDGFLVYTFYLNSESGIADINEKNHPELEISVNDDNGKNIEYTKQIKDGKLIINIPTTGNLERLINIELNNLNIDKESKNPIRYLEGQLDLFSNEKQHIETKQSTFNTEERNFEFRSASYESTEDPLLGYFKIMLYDLTAYPDRYPSSGIAGGTFKLIKYNGDLKEAMPNLSELDGDQLCEKLEENSTFIAEKEVDSNGQTQFNYSDKGYYILRQTVVPEGYAKPSHDLFYIIYDDGIYGLVFEGKEAFLKNKISASLGTGKYNINTIGNNRISKTLPYTGGLGSLIYTICGVFILLISYYSIQKNRYKNAIWHN